MVAGHRRRWPWIVVFVAVGGYFVLHALGGWFLAEQFHREALLIDSHAPEALVTGTIESVDDKTVVLAEDAALSNLHQFDAAVLGMATSTANLVVGPVIERGEGVQTRAIRDVTGKPQAGQAFGLHRDVWLTPADARLKDSDVTLQALDGRSYPAWHIAGESRRWAILIHDKGQGRSEMLRLARPLHQAKYNVLVAAVTGDPGAPASPDGMAHYGRTEWPDVEAAVQFAVDSDAEQVLLAGSGHGGAAILGFMTRGSLSGRIAGLILDAPVPSMRDLLDSTSDLNRVPVLGTELPETMEEVAEWMVAFRYGVDFSAVDYSGMFDLIRVPLLTFQGDADRTVPKVVNDRFMLEGSGSSGLYRVVSGAEHGLSWNVAPEIYEAEVKQFATTLPVV